MTFLRHKYYVNIPPKKVLKAYAHRSIPNHLIRLETDLREIKAANCNVIRLAENDIIVLQYISIVETARKYGMSINKCRIWMGMMRLLEYHLSIGDVVWAV